MAAPQPAMAIPREIVHRTISLAHKPNALIHYSFAQGNGSLVVFLNGLMTDKTSWIPVMANIIRQRPAGGFPSLLAYDRYGQGMTSDRDPQDEGREQGHGHDCADAAKDLHFLVEQVATAQFNLDAGNLPVILVANSIGCAIARLYAHDHTVAGLLFLDSIMANSDFDIWPDPDKDVIQRPGDLPLEVTDDVLREQRAKFAAIFHPSIPNKEGLSRRDLAKLLPYSDGPTLRIGNSQPWLTVVGHDFEAFADESLRTMGTPKVLSMKYSNPTWQRYNEGLTKLTICERSKGPIQAPACGHFIQRDNPRFVTNEILELLDKIQSSLESRTQW